MYLLLKLPQHLAMKFIYLFIFQNIYSLQLLKESLM